MFLYGGVASSGVKVVSGGGGDCVGGGGGGFSGGGRVLVLTNLCV